MTNARDQAGEQLTCISIILCDDVYRDELTKKMVIVGTFNNIFAAKLPVEHPKMCVLFTVTNGNGTYDVSLAIEHEASGREIVRVGGPIDVRNPLAIHDVNVDIRGVKLSEAGKYWIILRSGEAILQQRPFHVTIRSAPAGTGGAVRPEPESSV